MPHPPVRTDGKIESVITHLEMLSPPASPPRPPPRAGLAVEQAVRPTVSFYRYLYDTIGEPWLWGDRRKLSDAALAAIVQDPAVAVHVLRVDGVPAGYAELDGRVPGEIELAYFGLIPEFIGQKLGPYLLDWAIRTAWARGPKRVWVHTCTLDHPGALAMYERAGFVIFKRETEVGDDPRALGLIRG
ncbi:Histone acetyltransferase HPA2 [Minicystis rosea]|nr:Histone acetyltransferase HPA2 [Minicystis rosea]